MPDDPDVLLAASEAEGWAARSCTDGGEVTVPNTSTAEPDACSGCRYVPCDTCPHLPDDQQQEPA